MDISNTLRQFCAWDALAYFDTLALRQTDPRLLLSDNEDIRFSGSKRVVDCILDMDDVETTIVAFAVRDHADTTHVATTSHHRNDTSVESNVVGDLAGPQVDLDGVVDFDGGVGVSNPIHRPKLYQHRALGYQPKLGPTSDRCWKNLRSRIVRNQEWDATSAQLYPLDFSKFVLGLRCFDAVHGKATLGVVDEAEVLSSLFD